MASGFAVGCAALLAYGAALLGCGAGDAPPPPATSDPTPDAGTSGCVPGEATLEDGSCLPAGVPAGACAEGFVSDETGGCVAVLPRGACAEGTFAIPGETACHEVAACAEGPFGDIPVDLATQHVDASYAGGGSDGTVARPWLTIQDGIDAADPGGLVAIAEGTYGEDVTISGKPVRLWGRCPALVEIVGSPGGFAAVTASEVATLEMRSVAVRGGALGIAMTAVDDAIVERVWVHDTASRGVVIQDSLGPARVTLCASLVERATEIGVSVAGGDVTFEASCVRGVEPTPGGTRGRGIDVIPGPAGTRSRLAIVASVVEQNRQQGVGAVASDIVIEGSVVQGTLPQVSDQTSGRGVNVAPDGADRSSLTVRGSVVDKNHEFGVVVIGSDAVVETTVVRGTQPQASDLERGHGMNVQFADPGGRSTVIARQSVFEDNHAAGIGVFGSDLTADSCIVQRTQPASGDQSAGYGIRVQDELDQRGELTLRASVLRYNRTFGAAVQASDAVIEGTLIAATEAEASSGLYGRGLTVQYDPATGLRASTTLRTSLLDGNTEVGMSVFGSDVTLEDVVIRGTRPEFATGGLGSGLVVQPILPSGEPSNAEILRSSIEDNSLAGIVVFGSQVALEEVVVRGTRAEPSTGLFGDGLVIDAFPAAAAATVGASRFEGNARAGIANFGAHVALAGSVLDCNPVQLNGEGVASFDDAGGNTCGCAGEAQACTVLHTTLEAPSPIAE